MDFGAIIIGDEILLGRRQDKHFSRLIEALALRGLSLSWCEFLGDDPARITATLKRTLVTRDIVFCFGGIGATPDDLTRQCAAQAAGVPLLRHAQALAEIEAQYGAAAYPHRVLMADLPEGASLIPNPFNRIPGFSVRQHHFLPGFPELAWPMMDWVLDTLYSHLHHPAPRADESIIVKEALESELLELMNGCVARYPRVKLYSLPQYARAARDSSPGFAGNVSAPAGRLIELGVRGHPSEVADAMEFLKRGVSALGFEFQG
jgi:molybdopterin-biosynthesis enzyme MoeA-like protein